MADSYDDKRVGIASEERQEEGRKIVRRVAGRISSLGSCSCEGQQSHSIVATLGISYCYYRLARGGGGGGVKTKGGGGGDFFRKKKDF